VAAESCLFWQWKRALKMTDDSAVFQVLAVMKMEDCERLHEFVAVHKANDVTIDVSIVDRLDGLAAQTLVKVQLTSQKHGTSFQITAPSVGFTQSISLLGLTDFFSSKQVSA
jgi:chemotaxis protein CheX